jgi:hypothetical protein
MRLRTVTVPTAVLALALAGPAAPALAHEADSYKVLRAAVSSLAQEGDADAMSHVANVQYETMSDGAAANGSDIEFGRIGGRDYAFAGTLRQGLQIVDITDPESPAPAGHYACPINQGDVQVFAQGDRVLATYTADSRINTADDWSDSQCVVEGRELGHEFTGTELGTFLVDVTDPTAPTTVSWMSVPAGSHNMTVHPSGDFLYNSNSDLLTAGRTTPHVTIFDISNPDAPVEVQKFEIPFVPTTLGTEAHDITFNGDGSRAYFAAVSQTLVVDTRDPADPALISQIIDPAINIVHQSDPVTLTDRFGRDRDLLILTDERAGAAAAAECPGGGLHVYDITDEANPRKVGAWYIDEIEPVTQNADLPICTSHVLRIHEDQELLTIAWYTKGVRVLDISGLADFQGSPLAVAYGDGIGMTEVGSYAFPDSDTWSFKTNRIAEDGSFYGFGNDRVRGLDVYRFDGLDRTVPALEPVDLAPAAKVKKGDNGKGKGKKDALVVPFLPTGEFPTAAGLLVLAGIAVVAGNTVLVRRAGGRAATA